MSELKGPIEVSDTGEEQQGQNTEHQEAKKKKMRLGFLKRQKKTLKRRENRKQKEREEILQAPDEVKILDLKTFLSILHIRWKIFLILIISVLIVSATLSYVVSKNTVSCIMSLNYEESSKGRNPNGTRFNISEMRSVEVAQMALDSAGLTGQIDPKEIADAISITTYSNKSFVNNNDYYISSSYNVAFKKPLFKIQEISAQDMLNLICKEYKDKFYKEHIINAKILENENGEYEGLDYSDIGARFTLIADRIDRYLEMRINQAGSFVTEDGETFKSVRELISNFRSYDLEGYSAYIWENGVSENKRQQTETLTYLNNKLRWQYDENIKENQARISTINEYNQAMTSSILIPTYDKEDEFYMSRTKTGIDELAKDADKKMSAAKQIELDISMNEDKIKKLGKNTTDAQLAYASQMVEEIQNKISDIVEKVVLIDNEYIMQKTRNYITFAPKSESLIHRMNAKGNLVLGCAIFIVLYIFFVLKKKKKARQYLKDSIEEQGDVR